MAEIKLTPRGQIRLTSGNEPDRIYTALGELFERNWAEGLFVLASEKTDVSGNPALRYWQDIAGHYLSQLCHIPESTQDVRVPLPGEGEFSTWVLTAPPMTGGEYLSVQTLRDIWEAIDCWVQEAIGKTGGLKEFLTKKAPQWHQVGRVCFHLAENKGDPKYPFAFLATYSTGFGTGGQLKHLPLGKALEQYAGAQNRSVLINLLAPVERAADQVAWVQEIVDDGRIYRPMAWTAEQAWKFLQSAQKLEEAGLVIRLPNWWQKRPRPGVSVTIGQKKVSKLGADALLDFDVRFALGDKTLSEREIQALLAGQEGLVWFKGQWVEVDRKKLQEAVEHWKHLQKSARGGGISFIEGMRLLAGASTTLQMEAAAESDRPWVHINAGQGLRQILQGLRDPSALEPIADNREIRATLRPYQVQGTAWLHFLTQLGLGACLADDMGLGKTLQVLALLATLRRRQGAGDRTPSLLVIPASLLGNWRREAERFTPSLKLTFLHPAENTRQAIDRIAKSPEKKLADTDLAVTTYSMLNRQEWLGQVRWNLIILDEAQAIKNPSTAQSRSARKLDARGRIVLTGTPVENRLGDLWSLFDFLNPGLLGSARVFRDFVRQLEERQEDQFGPLRRLVGPYILRRLKTDRRIIADLPEKIETNSYCKLSKAQIGLYDAAIKQLQNRLRGAEGIARKGIVLQVLMRLKQICNHPSQLTGDGDYRPADSGKFLRLGELCEEIASRQEKVLIFTQFREITCPLADFLARIFGRQGLVLHGTVSVGKRKGLIEQFGREDGPPFFVLSLKAGGIGLNLTEASHIIHFDRWWNPAVENQATDRAFRIGQTKNVLVHKFVTTGTVEERIDQMLAEKQRMADEILADKGELNLTEMSDEQILQMVRLDVTRAQL
jgi:non-specific serine/threonine protein kinase